MARATSESGTNVVAGPVVRRLEWLDGVRGLAAFFVLLHHVWLMTIGGYPGNNGPATTDWLVFGHLAVSVFIVVSGFSLMLSPSNHGMRLKDGPAGFLRRRFWRIVPPFWAALIFSSVLIWTGLITTSSGAPYAAKDFFVFFFLIHDAVGAVSPNGVFWSIAIEWHIYFLFPLVLWGMRRYGFLPSFLVISALVVIQHVLALFFPVFAVLNRFSPAYLVLFLAGAGAAWVARKPQGIRLAQWLGTLMVLAFVLLATLLGTETIVANYFWIDLLVGMGTACAFVGLAGGGWRLLGKVLAWRPLAFMGGMAYSLYLCHAPMLDLVRTYVIEPLDLGPMAAFWLLLAIGTPVALAACYLFFWLCERPFLTIRSFADLRLSLGSLFLKPRSGAHRTSKTIDRSGTGKARK